jgi:Domain of unknown function (DUF5615)
MKTVWPTKSIPDEEVLTLATEKKRVLLTTNRKHFIRLHRQSVDHGGIIACTFDPGLIAPRSVASGVLLLTCFARVNNFRSVAQEKNFGRLLADHADALFVSCRVRATSLAALVKFYNVRSDYVLYAVF